MYTHNLSKIISSRLLLYGVMGEGFSSRGNGICKGAEMVSTCSLQKEQKGQNLKNHMVEVHLFLLGHFLTLIPLIQ